MTQALQYDAPPWRERRHKLTLEEVLRMWDAGVFPDRPELELIDGDLYEMPADGVLTRIWNVAIDRWLNASLSHDEYVIVPDKTLPLTEHNAPQPDFYVYPASLPMAEVTGARVSLVIEVSDSTLDEDRDLKAPLYEFGGVREYWIVDCQNKQVLVFRLENGAYGKPVILPDDANVDALHAPGLTLRLSELRFPR
jgi:Uma2 family endonuclease